MVGASREVIHSTLLVALYRCLLKAARALGGGPYKPATKVLLLLTLTPADFLTKQGLLLLSFCIEGKIGLIYFDRQVWFCVMLLLC